MTGLKAYRQQRGLSQRKLAKRAGLAYKTVQLLESGAKNPRWSTLEKMAKVLDLSSPEMLLSPQTTRLSSTATETAKLIGQDGEESWKLWLFEFVDQFRRAPQPEMITQAPDPNISPRILALLASTVESLCAENKIPAPWWCAGVPPLPEPWFVADIENLKAAALVESPAAFRQRNIFVLANFLSRA